MGVTLAIFQSEGILQNSVSNLNSITSNFTKASLCSCKNDTGTPSGPLDESRLDLFINLSTDASVISILLKDVPALIRLGNGGLLPSSEVNTLQK